MRNGSDQMGRYHAGCEGLHGPVQSPTVMMYFANDLVFWTLVSCQMLDTILRHNNECFFLIRIVRV